MGSHTTSIHKLVAPDGNDPINLGDDKLRALVDLLDSLLPHPGDLKASFQTADHDQWIFADGRNTVPRAGLHPDFVSQMLAAGFNGSDGSHIGVPDWRGKAVVGAGGSLATVSNALGAAWGEEQHQLVTAEIPAHSHPAREGHFMQTVFSVGLSPDGGAQPYWVPDRDYADTASVGGGGQHNNLQPSRMANVFIFGGSS